MVGVKRKLLSIKEILESTGGRPEGANITDSIHIDSVSIDSRTCTPGALFVPLKGENTDGHKYLREAASRGAALSMVGREFWSGNRAVLAELTEEFGIPFLVVEDPLTALQRAAEGYLDRFTRTQKVGITGSSGKTTTKELIGGLLAEQGSTAVSTGNYNSEIGVCLAAFEVAEHNDFAVFELGMNRAGEMDIITGIVKPDVAVITNIGTAHIGFLGSRENIAREKKRIFSRLRTDGVGFIYEDEPFFEVLSSGVQGKILPYGPKSLQGYEYSRNLGLDGMLLGWRGYEIHLALPGEVQIKNACAAIAVALHFGLDDNLIASGLEKIRPLFGRGEIRRGRVNLICEYYNANPESMEEAVDFLLSLRTEGRKIAVLGDMKELGAHAGPAHVKIGKKLISSSVDMVFLIGEEMKRVYDLLSTELHDRVFWADNPDELAKELKSRLEQGDTLLLKGSRAAALEEIEKKL